MTKRKRDSERVAAAPDHSPDEIVAEGVYIAAAATKLALKNTILVHSLTGEDDFTIDHYLDIARDTLLDLAAEAQSEKERLDETIYVASRWWRRARADDGSTGIMHSYGKADIPNLEQRRDQAEKVSRELRRRADDEGELRELITSAQKAAWSEISNNIKFNLDSEYARVPEDDRGSDERESRIEDVLKIDLPKLASATKRRKIESDHAARVARRAANAERVNAAVAADTSRSATEQSGADSAAGADEASKRPFFKRLLGIR